MELEEWLKAEHSEGQLESSGTFTVDVRKARVKLARFQMARGLYVAKLVQAGVLAGCSRIDFRLDGDCSVYYRRPTMEKMALQELLRGLEEPNSLNPDSAPACLVTGWLGAEAGITRQVRWLASDGSVIVIEPDGEVRVRHAPTPEVKEEWATLTLRNVGDCVLERRILNDVCSYSPVPITINGESLPSGWLSELSESLSPTFRLAERYWSGHETGLNLPAPDPARACFHACEGPGPWVCAVTLSSALKEKPMLRWVRWGVIVTSEELPGACPGTLAVACGESLQTDLSQFQLRVDEIYGERKAEVASRARQVFEEVRSGADRLQIPARVGAAVQGAMNVCVGAIGVSTVASLLLPALIPFIVLGGSVGGLLFSGGYYFYKETAPDYGETSRVRKRLKSLKLFEG